MPDEPAAVDRDAAYVLDIVDSCRAIASYVRGKDADAFSHDPLVQDAVARRLFIIGEAAKSLSAVFKGAHPSIDWRNIARLRDKLGHHYWAIELEQVWKVVTINVPALLTALAKDPILGR